MREGVRRRARRHGFRHFPERIMKKKITYILVADGAFM
jgi:hypothetical protein